MRVWLLIIVFSAFTSEPAGAQSMTMFDHSDDSWLYVGGQVNVIGQRHGAFTSPYAGENSFRPAEEHAISRLLTWYAGARLGSGWEALVHIESAGGKGLSDALGLAGFTNLDVVRNPTLGASPYVARILLRKVFALSADYVDAQISPVALASRLPARRIEIRAGKLGIADFFDMNAVGSDSHLQFTNWTIDNSGAYDYAADTRGYTYGVVVEYTTPRVSVRGGEALMPKVANGIELDWNVSQARGENLEVELHMTPLVLRLLAYANHANMGSYREAIAAFEDGRDQAPNIEAHRAQGRVKYGFGVNGEYATRAGVRVFTRAGWNEGHYESFAYTEANNTAAAGADITGEHWGRPADKIGAAVVSNGLSTEHSEYLRLGGVGFLLGDGTLRYGREAIVESYYTAHVWRGVWASAGLQYIQHPGYNRDRGPVLVEMGRVHVEF